MNEKPLIFYEKIANLALTHLTKNGLLFFEINQYLRNETIKMLTQKGFKNIELKKDFSTLIPQTNKQDYVLQLLEDLSLTLNGNSILTPRKKVKAKIGLVSTHKKTRTVL